MTLSSAALLSAAISALLAPFPTYAGSQSYTSPGTHSFTVPSYSSLTVDVKGAGGGSGAAIDTASYFPCGYTSATAGSRASSVNTVTPLTAQPGQPGGGAVTTWEYPSPPDGAHGTASGGSTNTTGGGSAGGARRQIGSSDTSGAGGYGGRALRTFTAGAAGSPSQGTSLTVIVGSGGSGAVGGGCGIYAVAQGLPGTSGSVSFTWTEPSASRDLTVTKRVSVNGNVVVTATLSKGSGTFVIDHPLDPKNKLLYHSFVESPDVLNVYDGIVALDEKGEAVIRLPAYYEALNTSPQYFLSSLDASSHGVYVKEKIRNNEFVIAGGNPGAEVSWMVTGVRHDPHILAHPIVPEAEKGPDRLVDKGEYLFPEYYVQQPSILGQLIAWVRDLF